MEGLAGYILNNNILTKDFNGEDLPIGYTYFNDLIKIIKQNLK